MSTSGLSTSLYITNFLYKDITPLSLSKFVSDRDVSKLDQYGGIQGLLTLLNSDSDTGLSEGNTSREHKERVLYFGENKLHAPKSKSLFGLMWDALHDKTLILLIIAACISLVIGIYQMLFVETSSSFEWLEGSAILAAVFGVIFVSALNDWEKDKKFRALHARNENRQIHVLRSSKEQLVSVFSLVVGDIILLETGNIIPTDGILLDGHSLVIDESSATGESKPIRKSFNGDFFLLSGTIVSEGLGRMLVLAVGPYSFHGQILESMRIEGTSDMGQNGSLTPLQRELFNLAEKIAYFGIISALLLFGSLLIKLLAFRSSLIGSFSDLLLAITNIFIQAITILVVAVPEGLPMAVTLTLAFASTRMSSENNLVRVLSSCETMGSATCICTDKTGTLTTNNMSVVGGYLYDVPFGILTEDNAEKLADLETLPLNHNFSAYQGSENIFYPLLSLFEKNVEARDLLVDSIILNSTAIVPSKNLQLSKQNQVIGSKTEVALLQMLQKMDIDDPCYLRHHEAQLGRIITDLVPFSSERKMMKVTVDQSAIGKSLLTLVKGAPELILASCSTQLQVTQSGQLIRIPIDDASIKSTQWRLSRLGLRTLAFAYYTTNDELNLSQLEDDNSLSRIFIGLVGIEDPLRSDVPAAVASCQKAGISIRMVTGDSLETASCIAKRAGILMRGGLAMEGPRFRSLDDNTLTKIVPRLQVLARSSPIDKKILVNKLKMLGDIVAVTGDGSNDGPALRAAHVGFSMGITGTEVAKEASSIILMDDKFSSIVNAVSWGRCVGDAVRKFLLFQLTVNVSAVVVAFISALLNAEGHGVFNALQLLWVNLLMDTLGALALATDRPTPALLDRKPEGLERKLVTTGMWIRILGMALFQISLLLFLIRFFSESHKTLIFNTFVMMQLWNEILCRTLPPLPGSASNLKRFWINPFKNLLSNHIFVSVLLLSIIGQLVIVQAGGNIFGTIPLTTLEWLVSIGIGATCIPWFYILNYLCIYQSQKEENEILTRPLQSTMASRERLQWHATVTDIQNGLSVFAVLRRARPILSN